MKTQNTQTIKQKQTNTAAPIESQNPKFLEAADDELYAKIIAEHGGHTYAEVKEDGYRLQLHKTGRETLADVKAYTRSGNTINLRLFPELADSINKLPACVLDMELRGGNGIAGFSSVQRRFRHKISEEKLEDYLASGIIKEFPVSLVAFDTLAWEGSSLLDAPIEERRAITENIHETRIAPSEQAHITREDYLSALFDEVVNNGGEGLVCKKPGSLYVPGSRTTDWIKVKRTETFDLAVIGLNKDENDGGITQIMCGAYNPATQNYEALVSVNARKDAQHEQLTHLLEQAMNEPANNTVFGKKNPELYVPPTQLVEVAAMNILRGKGSYVCGLDETDGASYSLRIGWLKSLRDDKKVTDATTTEQIAQAYAQNTTR